MAKWHGELVLICAKWLRTMHTNEGGLGRNQLVFRIQFVHFNPIGRIQIKISW